MVVTPPFLRALSPRSWRTSFQMSYTHWLVLSGINWNFGSEHRIKKTKRGLSHFRSSRTLKAFWGRPFWWQVRSSYILKCLPILSIGSELFSLGPLSESQKAPLFLGGGSVPSRRRKKVELSYPSRGGGTEQTGAGRETNWETTKTAKAYLFFFFF